MDASVNGKSRARRWAIRVGAVATIAALAGCANFDQSGSPERYSLKDGSTLVVDANGTMRMFTKDGSMIQMKEGLPMETADGTIIMMRENVLWKQLRQRGSMSSK
jgi:hypothetical protein